MGNTTEVLLVPLPSKADIDPDALLGKELFPLLSDLPVKSLPSTSSASSTDCRCFRLGAIWGHLEAPFGAAGDISRADSVALRSALMRRFPPLASLPPTLWRLAPQWRRPGKNAVRVLVVDRGKVGG